MQIAGWLLVILIIVIIALPIGIALGRQSADDPVRYAEAEAIRARTEADRQWQRAFLPIRLAFTALMAGVVVFGLALLFWTGSLYMQRRAYVVHTDQNGTMPALILRPGEMVVDLGALAGPVVAEAAGPRYNLPPNAIPQLQASANQGAATTRTMRAWAIHGELPRQQSDASSQIIGGLLERPDEFPPIEVLTGPDADARIIQLIDQGEP